MSEFLHNYIYDKLRTQSQVPAAARHLHPLLTFFLQLGYIVQAWCARKHGIGRIRVKLSHRSFAAAAFLNEFTQVLVQSQLDEKHVESEMLKASTLAHCITRHVVDASPSSGHGGLYRPL